MDFIEALPKVGGKSVIVTIVDRLSKYAHFIPLAHPYSATTMAHKFFSMIVRLHGLAKSIVSDRDVVFTRKFWQEHLSVVQLQMTSAYHPQSIRTAYQQSFRTTLFQLVYGREPPQLKSYSPGDAIVPSVDDLLTERDQFLEQTKVHLKQSQDCYRRHYDSKHSDRSFKAGEWV